jgi:hypothetical protein
MFCLRRPPLNPGAVLASLPLPHRPYQSRGAGSCSGPIEAVRNPSGVESTRACRASDTPFGQEFKLAPSSPAASAQVSCSLRAQRRQVLDWYDPRGLCYPARSLPP